MSQFNRENIFSPCGCNGIHDDQLVVAKYRGSSQELVVLYIGLSKLDKHGGSRGCGGCAPRPVPQRPGLLFLLAALYRTGSRHRALCRFLNSTTTLSARFFPTFRGPW